MKINHYLQICTFLLIFISNTAFSQTTYFVKTNGNDLLLGTSWLTAFQTLQQALSVATSGDQIWVAAGTYYPDEGAGNTDNDRSATFSMTNGVEVYGGFDGADNDFANRDWEANVTILSGDLMQDDGANFANNGDNSQQIIQFFGAGITNATIFDGFTITAGNGGISVGMVVGLSANPIINNCTITQNYGSFGGGGLGVTNNALGTFNNCIFSENSVGVVGGGVIITNSANPAFNKCIFIGNSSDIDGGGISLSESQTTITNCIFSGNVANQAGGGINIQDPTSVFSSIANLTNCTFAGNKGNGAISVQHNTTANVKNCIIWANTSAIFEDGTFNFTNCLVQQSVSGTGNINVDPLFVSEPDFNQAPTTVGDVNLTKCSPAIDAGTNTGAPADDFSGNSRPIDGNDSGTATVDIGAYEFQTTYNTNISITTQPISQTKMSGENVTFSVSATGNDLLYQWKKDGVDIMAANSPTFTLSNLLGHEAGGYTCVISNDCNSITSNTATLTITNITYFVKTNGDDAAVGTAWGTAFKTLQQALSVATNSDQIWVAAGTYYPDEGAGNTDNNTASKFDLINGVAVYGGFDGSEMMLSSRDWVNNVTILSGDLMQDDAANFTNYSDNALTVVNGDFLNNSTTLDGFTITAGNGGFGSGMHLANSNIIIENCTFLLNQSSFGAAGLAITNGTTASVSNCSFIENSASITGGGIDIGNSSLTIDKCLFAGNTANLGSAFSSGTSNFTMTNCIYTGNTGTNGTFYIENTTMPVTIMNSTFAGNNNGFGVFSLNSNTTVNVINSIIWANSNLSFVGSGATLNYTNCIVQENVTGTGNLNTDPLFTLTPDFSQAPTTTGDVTLTKCSPAIDTGTNTSAPTDDFSGNSRPIDGNDSGTATVDIGAYEFQTTYNPNISITTQPISQTKMSGENVTFTVSATGNDLLYQWKKDGVDIMAANSPTFTLSNLLGHEAGGYTCVISNDCNSITSNTATLTITDVTWFVKTDGDDAAVGTAWGTAFKTLQQALSVAATGDQIWVAAGTYYPDEGAGATNNSTASTFNLINGVAVYGGFGGSEMMLSSRDWVNNVTILSGDLMQDDAANFTNYSDNALTVVNGAFLTILTTLDGFSITAGNGGFGSGMHLLNSNIVIENCTFVLNQSSFGAGGLAITNSTTANISNCSFIENTASVRGGGISLGNSSLTIDKCLFAGNTANYGSAFSTGVSDFTMTNCIYTGNTGFNGTFYIENTSSPVDIMNCTFTGNNNASGAFLLNSNTTVNVINSIIWANSNLSLVVGGATLNYTNCIVQESVAGTGNLNTDPLFVSTPDFSQAPTTTGDVNLTQCSPAIDAATSTSAPSDDFSGNSRPIDGNDSGTTLVDIGAYEFQTVYNSTINITSQPMSQTKNNGENVTFSVTATGNDLLYQWKKDGVDIMSANSPTFTINDLQGDEWGDYTCTVSNCDDVISNTTTLTLTPSISIATQNANSTENIMTALTYQFTRTADPAAALTVNFEITGTATKNDFTVTSPGTGTIVYDENTKKGTITFPATSDTVTLEIVPTGENLVEEDETIVVSIAPYNP